ncbi:MAG: DNA polymerase III subunit gamma/tau [Rhodothermales bacterium]
MSDQRYLVAARKYRPQRFGELVAQEHITATLKNALRMDRLAHAYLFSGPRGVGKTTAARILAKAINCTTPLEERGDGAEPCRQCDSCRSFEEGRSLNIIEIDAASNNKVDDIRDLRETVRVPPQGSRKKVYIIDEVHMLSTSAFNALLKTLEEPPPYVLFIFATTEPHKVLATILSRCQRFDFRRIPVPEIVARLEEICGEEGITADEASLLLLARKGDGALRDALSAFDQAVSLCGTSLSYADLAQALGVVDVDLFFEVTGHVRDRSAAGMLRLVDRVVRAGYDLQEFLAGLAEHLRNTLVAATMPDVQLIEATEAVKARYAELGRDVREADLLRLLMLVSEAEETMASSTQPRLKLEMALLKMASLTPSADLREALAKLDRLEAMAREGKFPAALASESSQPASAPLENPPLENPPPKDAQPENPQESPTSQAGSPPSPAPPRTSESTARSATVTADPAPMPEVARPATVPSVATAKEEPPPQEEAPREQAPQEEPPQRPAAIIHPMPPRPAPPPSDPSFTEESFAEEPEEDISGADESGDEAPPADVRPTAQEPRPAPSYLSLFGTPALQRKSAGPAAQQTSEQDDAQALFSGSGALAVQQAPDLAQEDAGSERLLRQATSVWGGCVEAIKRERIHVGALLQHTKPNAVQGDVLLLAVPDDFHRRFLQIEQEYLTKHLEKALGESLSSIRFVIRETLPSPDDETTADVFDAKAYMEKKRQENPVVRAIFEQFGGELVW